MNPLADHLLSFKDGTKSCFLGALSMTALRNH